MECLVIGVCLLALAAWAASGAATDKGFAKMYPMPEWMYGVPHWFSDIVGWMVENEIAESRRGAFEDTAAEVKRLADQYAIPLDKLNKGHSRCPLFEVYFVDLIDKWDVPSRRRELIRCVAMAVSLCDEKAEATWVDVLESWINEAMGIPLPQWRHGFDRPALPVPVNKRGPNNVRTGT